MKYHLTEDQMYKFWGFNPRFYYDKSSFAVKCRKRIWNEKFKNKYKLKYHERVTNNLAYVEGKEQYINFFLLQL